MARQVMFDPFGAYTQGLHAGTQDEMQLQRQTRDARAMDYDFGVMAPLRTQQLEQGLMFDQQANPLRLDAMRDTNFATQLGLAGTLAQEAGVFGPREDLYRQRFGDFGTYNPAAAMEYLNQDNIFKANQQQIQYQGLMQQQQAQAQRAAQAQQYQRAMLWQAMINQGIMPPQMMGGQPQPGAEYGLGQGMFAPGQMTGGDDGLDSIFGELPQ